MTDTTGKVREHYSAMGLTHRIKSALATLAPEGQTLTVVQLAPLDQFHTRGILATAELATAAGLEPSTRVLISAAASAARHATWPPLSAVR